jgi:hypothetical protein
VDVADSVGAQPLLLRGGLGRGGRLVRVLAQGGRVGPGAGSRSGGGLGVAVLPQVVIEGVEDAGVDRVEAFGA